MGDREILAIMAAIIFGRLDDRTDPNAVALSVNAAMELLESIDNRLARRCES